MILESVDHMFVDAIIQTVLAQSGRWKLGEDVWKAFVEWSSRNGRGTPGSPARILYHQVQDLYDFVLESCPERDEDEVLKLCGRSFAQSLIRERLSDFLNSALSAQREVAPAIAALFQRFMHQYAPYIFRASTSREGQELRMTLKFSDRQAVETYLAPHGRDLRESFRRSFLMLVGTVEGCLEYLLAPWNPRQLSSDVDAGTIRIRFTRETEFNYPEFMRALAGYTQEAQCRHTRELLSLEMESDLMLQSAGMRATWKRVRVAAASDEIILLRGEPGTGKTHLARRIHEMSPRKAGPFVEVGLTSDLGSDSLLQSDLFGHVKGAFTSAFETKKGLFSLAEGGTVFLDEIGDAGPELQAKLLRVIERKVFKPLGSNRDTTSDVRIITATNRHLEARIREGGFRQDLFHRINVISIELPPLRERVAEIPLLCGHLLKRISLDLKKPLKSISPEVSDLLASYAWPGNLRELIHVLKHALLFGEGASIERHDLPEHLLKHPPEALPRRVSTSPAREASDGVIDFERLLAELARSDGRPVPKGPRMNCAWHVDYAKRIYLRALIQHFKGNLRKVAKLWDRASVTTVRGLIKEFDLLKELEQARKAKSPVKN